MKQDKLVKWFNAWCPKESLRQPHLSRSVGSSHGDVNNRVILTIACLSMIAIAGMSICFYTLPNFNIEIPESEANGEILRMGVRMQGFFVQEHGSRTIPVIITSKYGLSSLVDLSIKLIEYRNGSEKISYKEPQELYESLNVTFNPNPVILPANGQVVVNITIRVNVGAGASYSLEPRWVLRIRGESEGRRNDIALVIVTHSKPSPRPIACP